MVQATEYQMADLSPGSTSKSSSKTPSRNASNITMKRQTSSVGSLCFDLPNFVTNPPIEAVVFGWGVAEDGQLVLDLRLACRYCCCAPFSQCLAQGLDTDANVLSPKVVEALLGTRFRGRQFGRGPLVCMLIMLTLQCAKVRLSNYSID